MTPGYLSRASLAAYLEMSGTQVDRLVAQGRLPPPVYVTPRMPRWHVADVDAAMGKCAKSTDPIMEAIHAPPSQRGPAQARRRVG